MPLCDECGAEVPIGILGKGERRLCGPCKRGATVAQPSESVARNTLQHPAVTQPVADAMAREIAELRARVELLEGLVKRLTAETTPHLQLPAPNGSARSRAEYFREYRKRRAQAAG
jgi:hypothetical protein